VPPSDATPPSVPPAARPLALVADDDAATRVLLARLVARAGFAVTAAADGAAALRAARALGAAGRRPALLVSDVEMPAGGGVTLAAAVAGPGGVAPGLPVLLVSGRALPPAAAGALAGVRYAFLTKPFTAAAFDAALARLLR
jgi:two-component system phosphate regulon response regulator OmpR